MKKLWKRHIYIVQTLLFAFFFLGFMPMTTVKAEVASTVTIGAINYDDLTMQIYNNENAAVYYSTDQEEWTEVEGAYNSSTKCYTWDISWVSATGDVTLYLKGDTETTITSVTLPKQVTFGATYNKADGSFTFTGADESDFFEWRKASDYNWNKVSLEETSANYKAFINNMELLRLKGAKVILRIPQEIGTAGSVGSRPSKEVTITIYARTEAPNIIVNSAKLTLNTTVAMEYYNSTTGIWYECSKTMSLAEIAPRLLFENGAKDTTLMIRTAATTRTTYSKAAYIKIKGQRSAPEIGDNSKDVSYYFSNSKLVMIFNKATTTNIYEYSIVKAGNTLDITTARWTSVNNAKLITLSNKIAPEGCAVYVRRKGNDANTSKNIELVLSSARSNFSVHY